MQISPFQNCPRVLFLLNRLVLSGQSVDVIPLAHYLVQENVEVQVLYGQPDNDEHEALYLTHEYPIKNIQKIDSLYRNISPVKDIRAFFFIYRYIKKYQPDIIHTHGAKAGLIGRFAAKLAGVKVIIHTFHGHLFSGYYSTSISRLMIFTERLLAKLSTRIIALSNTQKEELVEHFRITSPQKCGVIKLGLNEEKYLQNAELKRHQFRTKYQIAPATVAIGIVGRLVPVKNHSFFIEVIAQLHKEGIDNVCFFIVGDGVLKEKLQQQLSAQSIRWGWETAAPVIFTSWEPDITEVIHGLDIVALTSINEGTPVSLIEAQLCAKPVVATAVGGVKDTFKDKETGFLVDGFDMPDFASKIRLLIDDAALRLMMGNKAQQIALRYFTKQREVLETAELYRDCLIKK